MNNHQPSEETILEKALAFTSAEARQAYLQGACGDNQQLRAQIESLIEAHEAAGAFLPNKTAQMAPTVQVQQTSEEGPGTRIGRYKLLQQIGEGGMGVVYMAEQEEPVRRRVALKIIKLGMDTRQVVARFEAERQALALMDHPNIAKVLDGGATDTGRPYFVMELVQGVPITEFCDKAKLSAKERLKLFIQVCQAIQSAHQKGIIHRDIKPSNVLVTLHDGVPVPKVIDFGIAKATNQKLTEKTLFTNFATMIGTPAYMSPEQAEISGLDIDTRTDIYALGVLLYALLTGTTPFPEKRLRSLGYGEMQRVILEEEPERPSTRLSTMANEEKTIVARNCGEELSSLSNLLKGDLDWIVMKALEKDRTRRYDTANGFAMDVKRFLSNEPVLARPPSAAYKFQKLVRRNKLICAAAGVIALTLILGVAVSAWQAVRAKGEAARANREAARAQTAQAKATQASQQASVAELRTRKHLYVADMDLAFRSFEAGDHAAARKLVESYSKPNIQPDPRGWEWRYLWGQTRERSIVLGRHDSLTSWVEFSPNGRWLGSIDYEGTLKLWDVTTRREWVSTNVYPGRVIPSLAWSPDARFVAMGAFDGLLKIWNVEAQRVEATESLQETIWQVAWSPDGKVLAGAGDLEIHLLDAETRKELRRIPYGSPQNPKRLAFSPDNQTLAISYYGPTIELWDWRSGEKLATLETPASVGAWQGIVGRLRFSPDGRLLAATTQKICRLWAVASRQPLGVFTNHTDTVGGVDFSRDGRTVLTSGGRDETIRIWDASTQRELAVTRDFSGVALSGCFAPDRTLVATGSENGEVKLWPLPLEAPKRWETYRLPQGITGAWIWPEHHLLNFFEKNGRLHLWDLTNMQEIYSAPWDTNVLSVSYFAPDQRKFIEYNSARVLQFRTVPGGGVEPFLPCELGDGKRDPVELVLSGDGRLAAAAAQSVVRIWEVATKVKLHEFQANPRTYQYGLYFSPDAKSLLARAEDAEMTIWRLDSGRSLTLPGHKVEGNSLRLFPDGQRFVTTSLNGLVKLRDLTMGRDIHSFENGVGGCSDTAFSPEGKRLVFAAFAGVLQFWDLDSNRQIATLRTCDHKQYICYAAFLNENTLASVFEDELRIWRAPSWEKIEAEEKLK